MKLKRILKYVMKQYGSVTSKQMPATKVSNIILGKNELVNFNYRTFSATTQSISYDNTIDFKISITASGNPATDAIVVVTSSVTKNYRVKSDFRGEVHLHVLDGPYNYVVFATTSGITSATGSFTSPYGGGTISVPNPNVIDPDTQLYLNQLPLPFNNTYKTIIDNNVKSLKSGSNNWSKLDRLVFFDGPYRDNAYTSVVNPTSSVVTEVGPVRWNNYGFLGDVNAYMKSGYTPSINGVNYTANNACFFYWVVNNSDDGGCDIGSQNYQDVPEKGAFSFGKTSGHIAASMNDDSGSSLNGVISDSIGLISIVRKNSSTVEIWKNGVLINSVTYNSTGIPALEFYILALNRFGVPAFISTQKQLALYGVGSGNIDQVELYNTILSHRNSVVSLFPSPSAPSVRPMNDPVLSLAIPSLVDNSGNGFNSTLGSGLPGTFSAPTIDGGNNLVFNGNQTIKLNTGFSLAKLNIHSQFFTIYTDTPEITQSLLNVGLQYACGTRITSFDRDSNRWVELGGVYFDEGAATEPVWGRSLPKLQKGYNVLGFSFSPTVTIMYCNGIITYFSPNNTYPANDNSGWLGAFPGGSNGNAYTLPAFYKLVAGSNVQIFNYSANTGQMQVTGDSIMTSLNLSQILFEGDSITEGFTLPTNSTNWPSLVSSYLSDNTPYKWAPCNIGIGGRYLNQMAAGCSVIGNSVPFNFVSTVSVDPVYPTIATSNKNVYVLFAGINDIANGRTLQNCKDDFNTLMTFRISQGYKCFVLTVTGAAELNAGKEAIRLAYNQWLRDNPLNLNYVLVDVCSDPNLGNQPGGPTTYFSDGIHLTPLGCSTIATMVNSSIVANY